VQFSSVFFPPSLHRNDSILDITRVVQFKEQEKRSIISSCLFKMHSIQEA
jgi:hypothetical protein